MATFHAEFLGEEAFVRLLHLEQRRTERSRRPFVFMLLECASLLKADQKLGVREKLVCAFSGSIRDTDIQGWYQNESSVGLIFTEICQPDVHAIGELLEARVRGLLADRLTPQQLSQIRISFYVFPDDWDKDSSCGEAVLYPETIRTRRSSQLVKRCLDVCGSLAALIVASPLFLVMAAAIKLTSKGPVLFRQQRVGQYGRKFTFFKFRSMYVNNNHAIHREFVKNLIAGSGSDADTPSGEFKVFKLTNDPRITPVGRLLRRTSLDEMPQFLNVLKGEMSLVGPRPPIPYEVEAYDIWHRRRLLGVKPGITGLWQVNGRSRTTFDEMVRLDLKYARSWSIWMDLKILLATPRAVLAGDGAY